MPSVLRSKPVSCPALFLLAAHLACRTQSFDTAPIPEIRPKTTLLVPGEYASLASAMEAAQPGDVVKVGPGEFLGAVRLKSGVTLRGSGMDLTTLNVNKGPVILAEHVQQSVVEDLRLESRAQHDSAIVEVAKSSLTLRRCEIKPEKLTIPHHPSHTAEHHGIRADSNSHLILQSVNIHNLSGAGVRSTGTTSFIDSRAAENKDGLWLAGKAEIHRSVLEANRSAGVRSLNPGVLDVTDSHVIANFQGLEIYNSTATITRSYIQCNKRLGILAGWQARVELLDSILTANQDGGMRVEERSTAFAERSIIADNQRMGAETASAAARIELKQSIIYHNDLMGLRAGPGGTLVVYDSIIAGHHLFGIGSQDAYGKPSLLPQINIKNSILSVNNSRNIVGARTVDNIIESDPRFVDEEARDFRLQPDSPGRRAGTDGADIGVFPQWLPPSVFGRRARMSEASSSKAFSAPVTTPLAGRKLAVVIGISDYQDPTIKDLFYGRRDAEAVADFLRIKGYEVRRLSDGVKGTATLRAIRSALVWLSSAGPTDRVIFYFSGHGSDSPNPLGEGYGFLLPADTDKKDLAASALPFAELRHAFERTSAQNVTLLLDTCFAAGAKSVSRQVHKKAADITGGSFGPGRVALYSSRDNEPSLESHSDHHGYFTFFLLDAWRREMRAAEAVYRHLYHGVEGRTKGQQHPRKEYLDAEGEVATF
ncbi:right-handed parallel beta-helix repeat-containing protein [Nannocystis pusilla]|uniref:right-handed parallel beta-helix repeat-containing protein n=1 Tax=Nannocystis pusilla TaxID=889268 RepID=UPI003BF1A65C